jgi:predicted short-subunit dehydrogenase-like oxidoreductase (DUF2520 family)
VIPAGPRSLRVVGPGRAGSALSAALAAVGWSVAEPVRRGEPLEGAAEGVDLLVLATPDAAIAAVAAAIEPVESTAVAHLAGSLGLDVLAPHPRRAALHPLVSLPDADVGARRLRAGAWFAVAGDPPGARALVEEVVADLGGRSFTVADADRAVYHAAAAIASNHLVALLGQVERVAASVGVPLEAYLDLVRATLDNVTELGPAGALTGPVARGDWATVERHRAALAPDELTAYDAMVAAARRLVDDGADAASTEADRPEGEDRWRS